MSRTERAAVALSRKRKSPVPDVVCFLCQQLSEKYVKAFLQEHVVSFKKTHDLVALLSLASPLDSSLTVFAAQLDSLNKYSVDFRYPGRSATSSEARAALAAARAIRTALRKRLGLTPRRRRRIN